MRKLFITFCLIFLTSCTSLVIPPTNNPVLKPTDLITVELIGEVKFPGLYVVNEGMLLYQVIELAGGFTENAITDQIPLVSPITSNQTITVVSNKNTINNGLVNINLANINELLTLPGIGRAKAEAIIKYRNDVGLFAKIDDLLKVSGIGETIFQSIKNLITI